MSVINQVLNQLEQRGANAAPEQTMVRAVPHTKRKSASLLLSLGLALSLALAGGVAAWQWIQLRKPVLSSVEGPKVVAVSAAQHQPVAVAPSHASAPVFASAPEPSSAVPLAVISATASAVAASTVGDTAGSDKILPVEMLAPASRLSFELSAIPLPSFLRQNETLHDAKNGIAPDGGEKQTAKAAPSARLAKPQPIQTASPNVRAAAQPPNGVLPMKRVSLAQQADGEFHKAVVLIQQGHVADAVAGFEAALRLDAGHDAAREALVAMLLEGKRGADAERILQDRLKDKPEHTGFAMLLARLQVEHGAVDLAAATLEKSLPYADQQADYLAFFAALLQRQNRHKEAIARYQVALQLAPKNGIWLMGYGISLQAEQRNDDAKDAFRRALESKTLNPELQAFVQQKLKGL